MLSKNNQIDAPPFTQMTLLAPPYVTALNIPLLLPPPSPPLSSPSSPTHSSSSSTSIPTSIPYVIACASHKGKSSSSVPLSAGSKSSFGPSVVFSYLYHEGGEALPLEGKMREPLSFKLGEGGRQQSQTEEGGRKGSTKLTSLFAPLSAAPQKGGSSSPKGSTARDRDETVAHKSVYVTCLKFSTDRETETPLVEEISNDRGVILGVALR